MLNVLHLFACGGNHDAHGRFIRNAVVDLDQIVHVAQVPVSVHGEAEETQ